MDQYILDFQYVKIVIYFIQQCQNVNNHINFKMLNTNVRSTAKNINGLVFLSNMNNDLDCIVLIETREVNRLQNLLQ